MTSSNVETCQHCGAANPKPTHILFILDKSGSMHSRRADVVGGINSFIAEQKKIPGKCMVSLVTFSDSWNHKLEFVPLGNVAETKLEDYLTQGNTALLDTLGDVLSKQFNPSYRHVVVIITDGEENASRRFNKARVKELIEGLQKDGVTFTYIGANQDAFAEARSYGIAEVFTTSWSGNTDGTWGMFNAIASNVSQFRTTGDASTLCYSESQRKDMMN